MELTSRELKRGWSGLCKRLGLADGVAVNEVLGALDAALAGISNAETMLNEAVASGRIAESEREKYISVCHGDLAFLRLMLHDRSPGTIKQRSDGPRPSPAAIDNVCKRLGISRAEYDAAAPRPRRHMPNDRPAGTLNTSSATGRATAADSVCQQLGITREEYEQAARRS